MSKIRRFEVNRTDDNVEIIVDGLPSDTDISQKFINCLNNYQDELDEVDNTIGIIMRSLKKTHSLSNDEYANYEQTLKLILKD